MLLLKVIAILSLLNVSAQQETAELNLQETRLATIPEGITFKPLSPIGHDYFDAVFSPNGRAVGYPASRQDKQFLTIGEAKGPDFSKVWSPVWSSDGRSWAYSADDGQHIYIVTKSKTLGKGKGNEWMGNPVFSPDGRQIAYRAGTRAKQVIVVGDRELGKGFKTVLGDPVFSPDGSKVAYRAEIDSGDKDNEIAAVDDQPAPGITRGYEGVKHIVFSPDGKRLAFVAETQKPLCVEFVVCDGKSEGPFGQIQKPVFSRDSKKVAYAAYEKGRWYPVVEGNKGTDFDPIGGLVFSPDGAEISFWARKGFDGPAFIVKGAWRSEGFPYVIWGPTYSPDGSQVAFGASEAPSDRKEFIVVGSKRGATFDEVWNPQYSGDGKKVAFGARIGRDLWWKIINSRD